MIEQIKQALESASIVPWKVGTASPNGLQNVGTMRGVMVCQAFTVNDASLIANSPEWLRHLIGEVERLKKVEEHAINRIKAETRGNYVLSVQVEGLQKALEYIADDDNHFDNLPLYAMKALERSKS